MQALRLHRALSCFALLILCLHIHVADAQSVELYDGFEDDEILDRDPVDWNSSITHCFGGFWLVEDGVALLGDRGSTFLFANHEFHGDVSLRTRGRVMGAGAVTGVLHGKWPGCPGRFSEYVAGVQSRGFSMPVPCDEGDAFLFRYDWNFGCQLQNSHRFPGGFDVTEEFFFQMDVRGNSIEVRIWRPDEPFPELPLLEAEDLNFRSGQAGIVVDNRVELDFIWIRDRMIGANDLPPDERHFRRGDANADGSMNISDATFILNAVFGGGPDAVCEDAADANDDAAVNISDGVFVLSALFGGGAPPPAPYQDCGIDPTDDALLCDAVAACR